MQEDQCPTLVRSSGCLQAAMKSGRLLMRQRLFQLAWLCSHSCAAYTETISCLALSHAHELKQGVALQGACMLPGRCAEGGGVAAAVPGARCLKANFLELSLGFV